MKFSSTAFLTTTAILVGSPTKTIGSFAESTQHLRSVSVTSEDVPSTHDATILGHVPRELKKKAKGSTGGATNTKAPKSTKKPKAPKSEIKVPKSAKGMVATTASPSPGPSSQMTSQPSPQESSPPTDDPCAGIATQEDALLAFKAGVPDSFSELSDWTAGTDACTDSTSNWNRITCVNGEVTEINLAGRTLGGTISPLLGCPTSLTSSVTLIYFGTNYFTTTIPTELGRLTGLTKLSFTSNSFTGTIPTEFGNLINLTLLDIGNAGSLTGTIPKELGNLTNLTSLTFKDISLSGAIPTELGKLTNLTTLIFTGTNNNFSEDPLIPTEICAIRSPIGPLTNLSAKDPPCECCSSGSAPRGFV